MFDSEKHFTWGLISPSQILYGIEAILMLQKKKLRLRDMKTVV